MSDLELRISNFRTKRMRTESIRNGCRSEPKLKSAIALIAFLFPLSVSTHAQQQAKVSRIGYLDATFAAASDL
jgi:hypothetical protein